jgi:hypothetical protein
VCACACACVRACAHAWLPCPPDRCCGPTRRRTRTSTRPTPPLKAAATLLALFRELPHGLMPPSADAVLSRCVPNYPASARLLSDAMSPAEWATARHVLAVLHDALAPGVAPRNGLTVHVRPLACSNAGFLGIHKACRLGQSGRPSLGFFGLSSCPLSSRAPTPIQALAETMAHYWFPSAPGAPGCAAAHCALLGPPMRKARTYRVLQPYRAAGPPVRSPTVLHSSTPFPATPQPTLPPRSPAGAGGQPHRLPHDTAGAGAARRARRRQGAASRRAVACCRAGPSSPDTHAAFGPLPAPQTLRETNDLLSCNCDFSAGLQQSRRLHRAGGAPKEGAHCVHAMRGLGGLTVR